MTKDDTYPTTSYALVNTSKSLFNSLSGIEKPESMKVGKKAAKKRSSTGDAKVPVLISSAEASSVSLLPSL